MMAPYSSFLGIAQQNDSFSYDREASEDLYELRLPGDDRAHGYIVPDVVKAMPWTADFEINHRRLRYVQVHDRSKGANTSAACNDAFAGLVSAAIEQDLFAVVHGEHSEPFRIPGADYPVYIERYAAPLFGVVHRGAHATAYTTTASGMKIWVPRRSAHLQVAPNMLDTTVAGGMRGDDSPLETIVHEAHEEASLPEEVVHRHLRAAGALTYMQSTTFGFPGVRFVVPDVVYVFDLPLDESVVPTPRDDEVKAFYLWSVDECKAAMLNGDFKPNCAVVMIDFFIRHGVITAESEMDYVDLLARMHRRLPFPTAIRGSEGARP